VLHSFFVVERTKGALEYKKEVKTTPVLVRASLPLVLHPHLLPPPSSQQPPTPAARIHLVRFRLSNMAPKEFKTSLVLSSLPPKQVGFVRDNYPRTPSRVDYNNPPWPVYRGYHEYSFAHATMSVRLPTILGKAIDDVVTTLNQEYDEERILDLTACLTRMEDLLDDLSHNAKLRPLKDDGEGDTASWNKEIAKFFRGKDFMNAPWLFSEAYKYRR
jgi:hypothetical protein